MKLTAEVWIRSPSIVASQQSMKNQASRLVLWSYRRDLLLAFLFVIYSFIHQPNCHFDQFGQGQQNQLFLFRVEMIKAAQ